MTFGVGSTAPLVACVLLPVAVALAWRRGRRAAALVRAAAMGALALVLAGAYVERGRPAGGACVVVAVDVSASVRDGSIATARALLGALLDEVGPDDLVGTVAFDGRPRVVLPPERGATLVRALPADVGDADGAPEDTNLGAAVVHAAALCPADRHASIALVTDGRETRGRLLAEAARLGGSAAIHATIPAPSLLPVASLRRLLAPTFVTAGEAAPIEAVVENHGTVRTTAVLQIVIDDAPALAVPLDLPAGPSVVAVPFAANEPRAATIEARLLLPSGSPPAVGVLTGRLTVTSALRALVATERAEPVVAAALARRGVQVDVVTPRAVGTSELAAYHVVVLDDVTRASFGRDDLEALAAWVDAGGGLVVAGGARTFGDPGLVGSALARLLPVELASQRPEPRRREPIALELVIDRSNSMGAPTRPGGIDGEKMEYVRRAALAVLEQLEPQDLVGAIAFDSEAHELGAREPVATGRDALAERIRALVHGGGTDYLTALEMARGQLEGVDGRLRHVILLTDGDSNRRTLDHFQVIDALARADITVSTIRVGTDAANLTLLDAIARATGGEFHHVENPLALPQLMLSDVREFKEAAGDRATTRVRMLARGPMLAGIAPRELPPLAHWAITRPKDDAAVYLAVEADERRDPILAVWQHGLGRVAALPIDLHAGGARWPTWNGFSQLWVQLVRWTARPTLATDAHLDARTEDDGTRVLVETGGDGRGDVALELDGAPVALAATAPRRFVARLPALTPGVHPAVLRVGGVVSREPLRLPARSAGAAERRGGAPDRALLERVAAVTGGRVDPTPAHLLAATAGVAREPTPLAAALLAFVLAALVADVALRRVRAA